MKKLSFLFIAASALFIYSCSGGSGNNESNNDSTSMSTDMTQIESNTTYKLPSPVELYLLIKDDGAIFKQDELHKIEEVSKYMTNEKKAINFGVYASDMAYCSVFEKQQETHTYFKTLKSLAENLGITQGYESVIIERLDKNLYNSDSLYQITKDSYYEVCSYLEENNKSEVLSQILLGGWTESIFLAISSVEKFSPDNLIVVRVTEQALVLEQLIEYLKTLKNGKANSEYLNQLIDLQYSFDKLIDNPEGVIVTKEQYKEIVGKVKALRASLIK